MAFQYGLTGEENDNKEGIYSWKILLEHAIALLLSLTMRREGVEQRPIVFVCHSFGAFILKKVPGSLRKEGGFLQLTMQIGLTRRKGTVSVSLYPREYGWCRLSWLPS